MLSYRVKTKNYSFVAGDYNFFIKKTRFKESNFVFHDLDNRIKCQWYWHFYSKLLTFSHQKRARPTIEEHLIFLYFRLTERLWLQIQALQTVMLVLKVVKSKLQWGFYRPKVKTYLNIGLMSVSVIRWLDSYPSSISLHDFNALYWYALNEKLGRV